MKVFIARSLCILVAMALGILAGELSVKFGDTAVWKTFLGFLIFGASGCWLTLAFEKVIMRLAGKQK